MRSLYGAPDLPGLVDFVNAQHGTTYRLTERYLGGERGAAGLTDAGGRRFVLKWRPDATDLGRLPTIIKTVDRLRSRWYPAPRYVARGLHPDGAYSVQAALPGAPVARLTPAQVQQLIALNDLQRGQAPPLADEPEAVAWPARVADDVLSGGDGYCLLDPMRQHGPETARLLGLVQELAARHRDAATPVTDIVHGDFQLSNILGLSGKISGIVDWDGTLAGDRAFDLATLLFYVYDQEAPREALWQRLLAIAEPSAVVLYLAHLIHRQVDWSIRHHEPPVVEGWLERARGVLRDLPSRTALQVPAWP